MAKKTWFKPIKYLLWALLAVVLLIIVAVSTAVYMLTPERLTPLVNRYGSEMLDYGAINVRRVELTFWSTFPDFKLQVDSLSVTSTALNGCNIAGIPDDAGNLLSVEKLSGNIDLKSLISGKIEIGDVIIVRPNVNIVQATPVLANYNVMTPSDEKTDTISKKASLPPISINRFIIEGVAPISYISLPDSIEAKLSVNLIRLSGDGTALYRLRADSDIDARFGSIQMLAGEKIELNGQFSWSPDRPGRIVADNVVLGLGDVKLSSSFDAEFTDSLRITDMELSLHPVLLTSVITRLPVELREAYKGLNTDMSVSADVRLTAPYTVGDTTALLPDLDLTITVPHSSLSLTDALSLRAVELSAHASVNGRNLDASRIGIDRLFIDGMGGNASISATITSPMSDPLINGRFKGRVDLKKLPAIVTDGFEGEISGLLHADTDFKVRKSYLSSKTFHRAKISGAATLSDFNVTIPSDTLSAYAGTINLRFGTSNGFVRDSVRIDSLLTVSIAVDTASVAYQEIRLALSDAKFGIGCRNTTASADTSAINPIGASLKIGSVRYISDLDSVKCFLRELHGGASLRRYADNARVPQLSLGVKAGRTIYGDAITRLILRDGQFGVTAHLRKPRRQKLAAGQDSVRVARRKHRIDSIENSGEERLDLSVDNSTAKLLRRWNVKGSVKARSARLFTPYFPLRNRLRNVDMTFTTDSVVLTNATLRSGHSDFTVSGAITNIRRTLIGHSRKPLGLKLDIKSDTIDVNQLVDAALRGAAFAQRSDSVTLAYTDDDAQLDAQLDSAMGDETAALLIPVNIDAELNMRGNNIIYSDITLHDFVGALMIYNGALNLRNLSARTEIGKASLNAMYYAPSIRDITFGLGLKLDRFQIDKVAKIIPTVDSLMPLMRDFGGVVDANLAATASVDSLMNIDLPSMKAALKLTGDSLVVLDPDTYKTIAKWLMFKNKNRNMIDHMEVELAVENSRLELYPFMFDFDRYRLGVMGHNDMSMNLNYHVSVLKSPIPFKFGINIGGQADNMKIRIGRAKFKENMVGHSVAIADTTRINLVKEFEKLFRRGINGTKMRGFKFNRPSSTAVDSVDIKSDTISSTDSLYFIKEGLLHQ